MRTKEIANAENLSVVEFTNGDCLTGFNSWVQVEELSEKCNLSIVSLTRKDGERFWKNEGVIFEAYDMQQIYDDMDDVHVYTYVDLEETIQVCKDKVEKADDMEEIVEITKFYSDLYNAIESLSDDEFVLVEEKNIKVMNRYALYYSRDVHSYEIALVQEEKIRNTALLSA